LHRTLFGTWPLEPMDETASRIYRGRIGDYMVKAAREAKIRTSWSDVDPGYETALRQFIQAILTPGEDNGFLADFNLVQRRLARFGLFNSLSQTLCKLMAPGVPDIYQGNELWDFSLVDPDNRRPVDYEQRRQMLQAMKHAAGAGADRARYARNLTDSIEDGRAKLFLTWTALQLRRTEETLFRTGDYLALRTGGARAAHLCAFARRHGEDLVIVIVPRLCAKLAGGRDVPPLGADLWADTAVQLPARHGTASLVNAIDGRPVEVRQEDDRRMIRVADVLAAFPVALLHRRSPQV
ncbi:MAG: malto-oligosyltrehalose synthase, partial [Gammaproteobacteria bacterium]|nr:malto-oligosyltrehalose synthase [Gammaproteobacteria bacterium]